MTTAADPRVLFEPFCLKSLHLRNRIVMAPMTRSFARDGLVGPDHVAYYRRRAEAEVGLILTEGTVVDRPAARNDPGVPFFHGASLEGWRQVAAGVRAAGGAIAPQLWHVGAVTSVTANWAPDAPAESPSGLVAPGTLRGQAMRDEDIADTVAAFARAAAEARRLGFDAVEVHGAHGYLVDQFFWPGTNLRSDHYGGPTLVERSRFAAEIIAAMRAAVGPDFALILRVSQWKQQDFAARLVETPEAMAAWLLPLVEAGVDILHCSQRRFWAAEFPEIDGESGLNFAGWAKRLTGAATISVGSVGLSEDFVKVFRQGLSKAVGIEALIERMERGEFDLIAVGRALLADPAWAAKVKAGAWDRIGDFDPACLAEFA